VTLPTTLSGPRRVSVCCRAAVIHPHSINTRSLDKVLALICARCNAPADDFLVVNALGEQLWPVPKGFKPARTRGSASAHKSTYILHIPLTTLRALFR